MATTTWLQRCSFALRPLGPSGDPLMSCFEPVQSSRPPGTPPLSILSTTISTSPAKPSVRPTTTPNRSEGKLTKSREMA